MAGRDPAEMNRDTHTAPGSAKEPGVFYALSQESVPCSTQTLAPLNEPTDQKSGSRTKRSDFRQIILIFSEQISVISGSSH